MSYEGTRKRRCIVQKLDFENCIVTNFRTNARGRKKLRARITREFQHFTEIPECQRSQKVIVPISAQSDRASSPVLIRKQCRSVASPACPVKGSEINSPEEELLENSTTEEVPSSQGSPVFRTFKRQKKANDLNKTVNRNIFDSQESSSSGLTSSFQIEEFTQESKQSVKISSVESPIMKTDSSSSYSGGADTNKCRDSPTSNCFDVTKKYESPKPVRKNYKKNSLLGRLQKLQQKQASEKLLWQHQKRKNSTNSLTVSIVTFWTEEFMYYLKCKSDSGTIFLIVDSRWAPNVRNVKEGSVLQLHPPWQRFSTEDLRTTIILSVICLDVLCQTKEPIQPTKRSHKNIPADQFETDRKLFVDSLFSSSGCGFLI